MIGGSLPSGVSRVIPIALRIPIAHSSSLSAPSESSLAITFFSFWSYVIAVCFLCSFSKLPNLAHSYREPITLNANHYRRYKSKPFTTPVLRHHSFAWQKLLAITGNACRCVVAKANHRWSMMLLIMMAKPR